MDPELYPSRKPAPKGGTTDEPSLWDDPKAPAPTPRHRAPHAKDPESERKLAKAAEIFDGLLRAARYDGLTLQWARPSFVRAGIISGGEKDRTLSWFGNIPFRARAVNSGRTVWINGNKQPIWLHPDFASPAQRSA